MGALVCNYFLEEASREHKFLTINRQDGHLQFDPNGITSDLTLTVSCVSKIR
jgi:hypothetical protein